MSLYYFVLYINLPRRKNILHFFSSKSHPVNKKIVSPRNSSCYILFMNSCRTYTFLLFMTPCAAWKCVWHIIFLVMKTNNGCFSLYKTKQFSFLSFQLNIKENLNPAKFALSGRSYGMSNPECFLGEIPHKFRFKI